MMGSDYLGLYPIIDGVPYIGELLSVFVMALELMATLVLYSRGLKPKPRLAGRALVVYLGVFVVSTGIAACVNALNISIAGLNQFSYILVYSGVLAYCVAGTTFLYEASPWMGLFCATAGYTTQNLVSSLTELIASIARANNADSSSLGFFLACNAVCSAVVFASVYLLIARQLDRNGLALVENRQLLAMMPVVSLVIIGFDEMIKSLEGSGIAFGYLVLLRLFHALACVATLWIEYQMLYRKHADQERVVTERLLAERERQYQLSRDTIDAINVKCHDLRHQIRSLASGGAVISEGALDELAREVSIYDSAVHTGNDALDTILTEKTLLCERAGITLTCIADGAALGFMAPADLYALFGNALDNAIEAVGALDDPALRTISLTVRCTMGCASMHVENFYAGERCFGENGLPTTTKADRNSHGFGTRSMRAIAERYGGTFLAEADPATSTFRLDVMIPLE